MTLADPKFFRPWRKRLGLSYAQAAETLGMPVDEYRKMEDSGRFLRLHLAVYMIIGAGISLGLAFLACWASRRDPAAWIIWFFVASGAAGGAAVRGLVREAER